MLNPWEGKTHSGEKERAPVGGAALLTLCSGRRAGTVQEASCFPPCKFASLLTSADHHSPLLSSRALLRPCEPVCARLPFRPLKEGAAMYPKRPCRPAGGRQSPALRRRPAACLSAATLALLSFALALGRLAGGLPTAGALPTAQAAAPTCSALHADQQHECESPEAAELLEVEETAPAALSDEELHGGWSLTWEVFDRATKHPNATVVSWGSPRVMLIRDFLTPEEVEHLVAAAEGSFERSEVVADEPDQKVSTVRTSYGAWLSQDRRDAKVIEIEHRIHDTIGVPHAFGETLHVLKYDPSQRYDLHHDNCVAETPGKPEGSSCMEFVQRAGGPGCGPGAGGITCGDRLATVILYLRSPTKGGATVLPEAKNFRVLHPPAPTPADASASQRRDLGEGAAEQGEGEEDGLSGAAGDQEDNESPIDVPEYCREEADTLKVSPPPGSALLFWDYVPGGAGWEEGDVAVPDVYAQHGGCPVLEGTKMIASRWIRSAEFH